MINSLLLASSFFGLISEPTDTSLTAPVELESVTIVSQSSKSSHISGAEIILTAAELQRFDIQDGMEMILFVIMLSLLRLMFILKEAPLPLHLSMQ